MGRAQGQAFGRLKPKDKGIIGAQSRALVTTQVDRLKVDRLKEKTCAIIIALQSSA
jgi:hypothetical protein